MGKELPDLVHSFTAEEWIGTNITPKLRHTENMYLLALFFFLTFHDKLEPNYKWKGSSLKEPCHEIFDISFFELHLGPGYTGESLFENGLNRNDVRLLNRQFSATAIISRPPRGCRCQPLTHFLAVSSGHLYSLRLYRDVGLNKKEALDAA
jgi:hypothetical protein